MQAVSSERTLVGGLVGSAGAGHVVQLSLASAGITAGVVGFSSTTGGASVGTVGSTTVGPVGGAGETRSFSP